MNIGQQLGGQQIGGQQFGGPQTGGQMINPMFRAYHAPNRHVEARHQAPDPQPPLRQDADAYWADKIAEVMREQFGIKPKVNTYSIGLCILPHMISSRFHIGTRCQTLPNFPGKMTRQPWSMSTGSSFNAEKLVTGTN